MADAVLRLVAMPVAGISKLGGSLFLQPMGGPARAAFIFGVSGTP